MNSLALSFKEKLGYGIGGMGADLSYGLNNSFFSNYLTDILKIRPGFLSGMFLLARVWDGINDPMMGTIVQNTRSKWGRFRPWILTGGILNALVLIMMFTNPGLQIGGVGVYVYATVAYVLWGMSYTVFDIPYWSFVPALTTDPKERNTIASLPRFFCGLGQALVSLLTVSMVDKLGGGNDALGFRRWAVICACVYVAVVSVTVSTTRERYIPDKKEKFTFGKAFKIIKSNDQLLVFMLTAILFNTGWYLTNGLGIYYFKHVLQNEKLYAVFAGIVGIGQMIGLLLFPVLSAKFTKHKVIKGMMLLSAVSYLLMYLLKNYRGSVIGNLPVFNAAIDTGFVLFGVCALFACVGVGAMFVSQTVMLADVVDYGEFLLGERTDSIVFSMKSFLLKVAYSLQAVIMFLGLEIGKYNTVETASQPESAKNAICFMMFFVPVILIAFSFTVFTKRYKLHGEFYKTVNAAATAKRRQLLQNQDGKEETK